MAAPDADRPATGGEILTAVRNAALTALVVLGLCVPIILLRTDLNIDNELILNWRWGVVAIACAVAFGGRLAFELGGAMLAARPKAAHKAASRIAMPSGAARAFAIAGVAFLSVYPMVALALTGSAGSIKWIDNYGVQILIYVMLGWGLNIVVGLAGLLDLGYVAFYAVGAYTYALLATSEPIKEAIAHLVGPSFWPLWGFWICLPVAGFLAAFWGILLGFPVLRLRGDYLAIVTLAFGEIIRLVLVNWVDVTNGNAGIVGIPRPSLLGIPFNAEEDGFAARVGIEYSPIHRTIFLYYVILILALVTNWVTMRLRRLPVGRAWEALREDEVACRSLGINTTTTKLTAFAIGAAFGGIAGVFYAARQAFVNPESFTFIELALILWIVVLGGMGSQIGVALAAVVMIGGTEMLRELEFLKLVFGKDFDPVQYRMLLFGVAGVLLVRWKPRGLVSSRTPTLFLKERRAISADLVKEGHG